MEFFKKTKENVQETNRQVISQSVTFISSAFVLIAALAWNEAIKDLINQYFKTGSGLISKFIYALIVTLIAIIVTMRLNKLVGKYKEGDK